MLHHSDCDAVAMIYDIDRASWRTFGRNYDAIRDLGDLEVQTLVDAGCIRASDRAVLKIFHGIEWFAEKFGQLDESGQIVIGRPLHPFRKPDNIDKGDNLGSEGRW